MIYPNNFEHKISFDEIRTLLKGHCLSSLGKEKVDEISFLTDYTEVCEQLELVREFRRLQTEADDFPMQYFFDVREAVSRIRLENTHLEEQEVWDLRRSLETISNIVKYLNRSDGTDNEESYPYPALHRLTEGVVTFPAIIRRIDSILDKFGKIKDSASMTLAGIRHELAKTAGNISRTLYTILHSAQKDGLVDKDAAPTLRDGRLVIPVAPNLKKRINGIVHDESSTGKTVFIEPTEVVEANNRVRQLEAEERREIIRILTVFSDEIRPHVADILDSYRFLATIDLIYAKAQLAEQTKATEPDVKEEPHLDWIQAIHPLLDLSLTKQGKKVVPLDIRLETTNLTNSKDNKNIGSQILGYAKANPIVVLLVIVSLAVGFTTKNFFSWGNFNNLVSNTAIRFIIALGVSGCLITKGTDLSAGRQVGLAACLAGILCQRGDYSARLFPNIPEMRTEPTIGGAIAEAMLKQFWEKKTFGVITTHYQNLKHFAEDHEGVVNGAMLYDRHEMQALFQLSIGQPGSSFAIEIARKTGIPEEVIKDASDIVGSEYIQSDKYLQDIVRDKRYWEGKRQTIHQHEKSLEGRIAHYESSIEEIEHERKEILRRAKEEAEELLRESNKKIENAIREIRESQAEKETTRRAREELNKFKEEVADIDTKANDEVIERKIRQIQERKVRKEKRRQEKAEKASKVNVASQLEPTNAVSQDKPIAVGDYVRIKGLSSVGTVEATDGKMATVIFGDMKTKMRTERLEHAEAPKPQEKTKAEQRNAEIAGSYANVSSDTRGVIDNRKLNFHQDIDVRGMRGDEAINAVTYFIDDAILVGMSRVRILHGTGTGILRQLIRQYLSTVPNVSHYRDEHVQFGGAGITVVDLE